LLLAAAYLFPALTAWALLGFLLNLPRLGTAALFGIAAYGVFYGFLATSGMEWLPAPSLKWQVPFGWVQGRGPVRKALTWGSVLGPGFATINPYAGFWLLPLVAASVDNITTGIAVAAALGGIHAMGRTLALMRDIRREEATEQNEDPDFGEVILNYKVAMVRMGQFRALDGYLMIAMSGVALIALTGRFGAHLS
jgi:hypothetical protein